MTAKYNIAQLPTEISMVKLSSTFPRFPPEELFQHFTQPSLLVKWWPQKAAVDPRRGGRYKMSWPAMNWHLHGTYLEFEPSRKLAFTWQWKHEPYLPQRQVKILFLREGAGTRIELVHRA